MEPYQQLEQEYAEFTGSEYAVSCNSGTSALHLALMALGIGEDENDAVLVPDFTMAACGFAVSYTGATPIFYDAESGRMPDPWNGNNIDWNRGIHNVKAVMIVHVYGRLAPQWIWDWATENHIPIIEDAAEAHGAVRNSKADMTCYSFFKNKIIHGEEGGMVTTDDKEYADRMHYLKNMAFTEDHDYYHFDIGYNYRMSNLQARVIRHSLSLYESNNKRRREIEALYDMHLPNGIRRPPKRDAVWFYDVTVPDKKKALEIPGVRDSFKNLSSFPMYGGEPIKPDSRVLLPVNTNMTEEDVINICNQL
jgi:perosamine synthetase